MKQQEEKCKRRSHGPHGSTHALLTERGEKNISLFCPQCLSLSACMCESVPECEYDILTDFYSNWPVCVSVEGSEVQQGDAVTNQSLAGS